MMRVVAFRPEPGLSRTIAAGRKLGLDIRGQALATIDALEWSAPNAKGFDGLLAGSANVFRLGGPQMTLLGTLPTYCVGRSTAQAAQKTGFNVARTGSGGLQAILDSMNEERLHLLRLTGSERVDLTPPENVRITEIPVYTASLNPLDSNFRSAVENGLVLLHSAAIARQFASECKRLNVDLSMVSIAALGPRIATSAGEGWHVIYSSKRPNDAALLELALQICKAN